jgi:hypothetical protein
MKGQTPKDKRDGEWKRRPAIQLPCRMRIACLAEVGHDSVTNANWSMEICIINDGVLTTRPPRPSKDSQKLAKSAIVATSILPSQIHSIHPLHTSILAIHPSSDNLTSSKQTLCVL